MMGLIKSEYSVFLLEQRRYLFETVSSLILFVAIFTLMFYGSLRVFPDSNPTVSAVGFLFYIFVSSIMSHVTKTVSDHLKFSTMESIHVTGVRYRNLLLARVLARFGYDIFVGALVALVFAFFVDWTRLDLPALGGITLCVLIATPAVFGIALVFAGLQIRFKRSETVSLLGMILLIGAVILKSDQAGPLTFVPLVGASTLARQMAAGEPFQYSILGITLFCSLFYYCLGSKVFERLTLQAKELGILGHK